MGELAEILGYDSSRFNFAHERLTDPELLDSLHWSEKLGAYADFGHHSNKVVLQTPPPIKQTPRNKPPVQQEKIRHVIQPPEYDFVNMFGYVSLFPLALEIIPPSSHKLEVMIRKLDDPSLLWTPYGLRSLAANASLYNKRNTEHDPPYWRGPIWININFLTLKALRHYSNADAPVAPLAKDKYQKLRENIMNNVISQYHKTGYIWEQYDDTTGKGKGCRPFTGWSSLVVLIMAEEY